MENLLSKWRQRVMQVKQQKALQRLPGNPDRDPRDGEGEMPVWL